MLIGSGIGGLPMIEQAQDILTDKGPRKVSPFFIPSAIINMAAGWVSMPVRLQGSQHCDGHRMHDRNPQHRRGSEEDRLRRCRRDRRGRSGEHDNAAYRRRFLFGKGAALRNDEPQRASRPFDTGRDGFVLGEGAGILVLEELEHAKARGAKILCEIAGYGTSGDAHHITAPPEDGYGAGLAMSRAIEDSGLALDDFDHINAHGTSTPLGDKAETLAVRKVFGKRADDLVVSATKSMTGHLLGAAGRHRVGLYGPCNQQFDGATDDQP